MSEYRYYLSPTGEGFGVFERFGEDDTEGFLVATFAVKEDAKEYVDWQNQRIERLLGIIKAVMANKKDSLPDNPRFHTKEGPNNGR
jgi:hypothetical protein